MTTQLQVQYPIVEQEEVPTAAASQTSITLMKYSGFKEATFRYRITMSFLHMRPLVPCCMILLLVTIQKASLSSVSLLPPTMTTDRLNQQPIQTPHQTI